MISIYDIQGNVLMQVPITPECEHAEELMRTDEVRLFWDAASNTTIPDGAYVIVGGENYYLVEPYAPTQRKENQWRYEPVFISAFYALSKVPFYMYTYEGGDPTGTITAREADWVLTTDAATFMDALCVAIKNETGLRYTYAVAQDLPASKTITFNSVDLISALNAIANAFETEFWLEKYATPDASGNIGCIHLSFANDGASAKVLAVGTNVNVPSVSDGREGFYNRFVVLGSTRNITQDYQGAGVNSVANKRLTLDPTDYPNGYIDYANGSKPYTKILTFDDIYPASNLRIKAVLARTRYVLDDNDNPIVIQPGQGSSPDVYDLYNIYYVKLEQYNETTHDWNDFVFNNTDYDADTNPTGMRLPNMPVSVHFESGPLRGREFELKYLDNPIVSVKDKADTTTFSCPAGYFEIIKTQEGNYIIPSLTGLVPAANDQVILFNIKMPDAYVTGAQERLEAVAFEEIGKNYIKLNADGTAVRDASGNLIRIDKNSYQLASNPAAFSASNPGLKLASAVTYVNGNYSLSTRVKALVTKLDFGFKQTITIGEEITKGPIQELKEAAANANQNIDLLDALNTSTQRLLDAYNRTQELIQARQVDAFLQLNPNRATLVELRDQYNYFGPRKGLIFGETAEADVENSPAHMMLRNFGTAQNPKYALYTPFALVTGGDQIVINGEPGGGGGGGVMYLSELLDVSLANLAGGQVLSYDSTAQVWKNRTLGEAADYGVTNVVTAGDTTHLVTGAAVATAVAAVLKWKGITTTDIAANPSANPIIINGQSYTAVMGDVVVLSGTSTEYLYNGTTWEPMGDEASYALKTVTITGTGYLTGGGTLEANRTLDIASSVKTKIDNGAAAYGYFSGGVLDTSHLPAMYIGDAQVKFSAQTAQDVGGLGNLTMANATYLRAYNTARDTLYNLAGLNASNYGYLGAANSPRTYMRGQVLYFLTGNSGNTSALTISNTQNATFYGSVYLQNAKQIYWKSTADTGGVSLGLLNFSASNTLLIGSGLIATGDNARAYNTYLYGGTISFYTGDSTNGSSRKWMINSSGTLYPYSNKSYNLGAAANYIKEAYIGKIFLASGIYMEYNSTDGYVHINAPLVTDGDQIVVSGTPGGGGTGGSQYLWELLDVDSALVSPTNGDVLQYNSTDGKWKGVASDTIGITTAGTVAELNAANPTTAKRVWSPSVLASWLSGKNYVENVAIGTGANAEKLAVTRGGSTSYLTVPYATNVVRFKRYDGTLDVQGGYDLNTLLAGGGITSQYNLSTTWANAPENMSYGGAVQLNPLVEQTLAMQLAWDVVHKQTQGVYGTGKLWWRDATYHDGAAEWGAWHLIYDDATLTKSVLTGLLDAGAGTYVTLGTAQTITGAKTFDASVFLNNARAVSLKDSNGNSVEALYMTAANVMRIAFGQRESGTVYLGGKTINVVTADTASGPDIYIGGISSESHNKTAASIHFHSHIGPGQIRNGVKVAADNADNADRLNLAVYTSNNVTSPWAPAWNKTLEVTYNGKVNIGAPSFSDGALNVNGAIVSSGDQIIASDERIKRNFKAIELSVEQIASCRAVSFDWVAGGHSFGSIAQDWEPILPEAVKQGDIKTLAYGQAALVAAINIAKHETEQDKEIRKLRERVADLEKEVKRLTA